MLAATPQQEQQPKQSVPPLTEADSVLLLSTSVASTAYSATTTSPAHATHQQQQGLRSPHADDVYSSSWDGLLGSDSGEDCAEENPSNAPLDSLLQMLLTLQQQLHELDSENAALRTQLSDQRHLMVHVQQALLEQQVHAPQALSPRTEGASGMADAACECRLGLRSESGRKHASVDAAAADLHEEREGHEQQLVRDDPTQAEAAAADVQASTSEQAASTLGSGIFDGSAAAEGARPATASQCTLVAACSAPVPVGHSAGGVGPRAPGPAPPFRASQLPPKNIPWSRGPRVSAPDGHTLPASLPLPRSMQRNSSSRTDGGVVSNEHAASAGYGRTASLPCSYDERKSALPDPDALDLFWHLPERKLGELLKATVTGHSQASQPGQGQDAGPRGCGNAQRGYSRSWGGGGSSGGSSGEAGACGAAQCWRCQVGAMLGTAGRMAAAVAAVATPKGYDIREARRRALGPGPRSRVSGDIVPSKATQATGTGGPVSDVDGVAVSADGTLGTTGESAGQAGAAGRESTHVDDASVQALARSVRMASAPSGDNGAPQDCAGHCSQCGNRLDQQLSLTPVVSWLGSLSLQLARLGVSVPPARQASLGFGAQARREATGVTQPARAQVSAANTGR